MPFRNARTSRAFILKGSAKRSIRVLIRNRFFMPKTERERMFSFGKEGGGIWLTTKSRTDTSAFRSKNFSGVGRYRQMLLRCHARAIPVRGGVGELWSVTAMIADRQFCMIDSMVPAPISEISFRRGTPRNSVTRRTSRQGSYWPKADISHVGFNVVFLRQSGRDCPNSTAGHT